MWLFDEGGDVAFVIGNKFFSIVFVWFECILVVMAICLHVGSMIVRILNVIVVVVVLAVEVVVAVVMVVEANNCISTNTTDFLLI